MDWEKRRREGELWLGQGCWVKKYKHEKLNNVFQEGTKRLVMSAISKNSKKIRINVMMKK